MPSSLPLISVILPAHNAEATIRSALKSTLRALPKNAELLVFLDACTDSTKAQVESLPDTRIRLIESEVNVGVAAGLNILLAEAKGTFVARMDADDLCLPWRFRIQLRKQKQTNADFVFTNAILFGSQLKPFGFLAQLPFGIKREQANLALIFANPFVHPAMLAKRSVMNDLGGYNKSASEDYELWIRAAMAGKSLVRTRSYGLLYRVHAKQLTQQGHWQATKKSDEVLASAQRKLAERVLNIADASGLSVGDLREIAWSQSSKTGIAARFDLLRNIGVQRFVKFGIRGE